MVKRKSEHRQTQTERSEATRAALLIAAHDLFAEHGYSGASSEAIVAAAGVSRGALQHHFVDKQSLFMAVYEQVERDVVSATAEAGMAVGQDDPLEVFRAGCHAYLDAVLDPAVQRICAIDGPAVLSPETRNAITDRYALGLVRETVQQAVEQHEIVDAPTRAADQDAPCRRHCGGAVRGRTAADPLSARAEAGEGPSTCC